ncbi:actin family [Pilobolus umbonatus]|nr:actin family [Pilobolus umbonatus]
MKTVLLDNGASTMKVGFSSSSEPKVIPNAVLRGRKDKRHYIGDQIETCQDFSSLFYRLPFEKGLLVQWGIERDIWDRLFTHVLQVDPKDTRLMITEPCFNLSSLQDSYDQVVFEEYEFQSYLRTPAPQWAIHHPSLDADCSLVVDSGYSFTHFIPFVKKKPVVSAIRRLNVGGKVLTNQLKEVVSFRSYDMMEEAYIMNDVKEQCCYLSKDMYKDLAVTRSKKNTILQEYVLPDFIHSKKGHIRTPGSTLSQEQILVMNNERFMIPEILMHPSDIGIQQAGIAESIKQSVDACDKSLHGLLYANIVLIGGNSLIPGYKERIEQDLRPFVPIDYDIRIVTPDNPITFSWEGGQQLLMSSTKHEQQKMFVQRKEYMEYGSDVCRRKFNKIGGQ